MLQHVACPRCGAENLTTEPVCFACGTPLGRRPRAHTPLPTTPWLLYLGALLLVALFGVVAFYGAQALAAYRLARGYSTNSMLAAVALATAAGQYGFHRARRKDRALWERTRAPRLPLKQADPGDAVWLRGSIACDAPLDVPYMEGESCVYYELRVQERRDDNKWRTTEHEKRAVDFWLTEGEDRIYVPTGDLAFEAPLCVDTYPDTNTRVKVHALLVQWQISFCGRLAGETGQRHLDRLSDAVPALATHLLVDDYLAGLARSERVTRAVSWAATLLAGFLLLATLVQA